MATDTMLQTMEVQTVTPKGQQAGVNIKVARMVRTGLVSAFLIGFVNTLYHRWLSQQRLPFAAGFLDGQVGLAAQFCAALPVLYRVAIDLVFWEPMLTSMYITLQALLRGQPKQIIPELKAKVLKIWAMAPRYWLFADLINFSLVSVQLRPLVGSLFNIPWAAYLSRMANLPNFDSPDEDARRDYAQLLVNSLNPEDGQVNEEEFKQFWNDNKVNMELAEFAGARRKGFWRKPVAEMKERQQAALVVKLLAELQAQVPSKVVSEMRVVLADVKNAEQEAEKEAAEKEAAEKEAAEKEAEEKKAAEKATQKDQRLWDTLATEKATQKEASNDVAEKNSETKTSAGFSLFPFGGVSNEPRLVPKPPHK